MASPSLEEMGTHALELPKIYLLGDLFLSCVSRGVQVDVEVTQEEGLETFRSSVARLPDEFQLGRIGGGNVTTNQPELVLAGDQAE